MWAACILLAAVSFTTHVERTWKTEDGKYSVDATFVKIEKGTVTLKKSNGSILKVDATRFSAGDKRYIVQSTGWGKVWIDDKGDHATIADLIKFSNDIATLELLNGSRIEVPYKKFSARDQRYLLARRITEDKERKVGEEKAAVEKAMQEKLAAEKAAAEKARLESLDIAILDQVEGRVVGITDGDTVTLLVGKKQHKIRLEGVDAPEQSQAFGNASKKHLSNLCFSKPVTLKPAGRDKYGRVLGRIFVGGKSVSESLIENGFAWHYKKYSTDEKLATLEVKAKESKQGLWSEANPIPPWDFRKTGSVARKKFLEEKTETNQTRGPPPPEKKTSLTHWLNTGSNTRHNSRCRWYANTKRGRKCTASEGKACGTCGG